MKFKEQFTKKGRWIAAKWWIENTNDSVADIASFLTADLDQEHLGRSDEEMCANAELCAQAPAMFALLKKVAAACCTDLDLVFEIEHEIRACLSRARGDDRQAFSMGNKNGV